MAIGTGSGYTCRCAPTQGRQQGLVLVFYTASLVAMVGMAALALDLGRGYLAKTRLQNALDAAALDAAKTLFDTGVITEAQAAATASLTSNGFASVTPAFTFTPAGTPKYVHLQVTGYSVTTLLAGAIGVDSMSMDLEAKAGTLPLGGQVCGAPIGICGDPTSTDSNCTDGSCWGITGQLVLKGDQSGTGFYGLLDAGSGAADVNAAMSGEKPFCTEANEIETAQGGLQASNAKPLNSRFGTSGPGTYDNAAKYPPDVVTTPATVPTPYSVYEARLAVPSTWDNPNGSPRRRTFAVPIIDCAGAGASKPVPVLGSACFFMTRDVPDSGVDLGTIYGQLVDKCISEGGTPGGPGAGSSGAVRIVLFQAGAQS